MNIRNHKDKIKLLRDRELRREKLSTTSGIQETAFCTEPGLYRIIGSVQKSNPFAEKFQDWLYEEVIPSIRKTGAYIVPGMSERQLCMKEEQLKIDAKKVEIEYLNMLSNFQMTSTDVQLRMIAADAIKNSLLGNGQKAIEGPQLRTLVMILRKHGLKSFDAAKLARTLGMRLSNLWLREKGNRPPKIEVHTNGDIRPVNAYPDTKETWKMIKSLL